MLRMPQPGGSYGWTRSKLAVIAVAAALLVQPGYAFATLLYQDNLSSWSRIDLAQTGAVVDTAAGRIRLPTLPATVAFWPDGSGQYAVVRGGQVETYHWDGQAMHLGETIRPAEFNPLAVAFADSGTMVMLGRDRWQAYQWSGGAWSPNPYLVVTGRNAAVALAAGNGQVVAAGLDGVESWSVAQANPVRDAAESVFGANTLAVALMSANRDLLVLTQRSGGGEVTYYSRTGAGLTANPFLTVTGLSDPRAVVEGENGNRLVLDGTEVRAFVWTGSEQVSAVLSGFALSDPTAVAVQPGSGDLVMVDGGRATYYQRQPDNTYRRVVAREAPVADVPSYHPARWVQALPAVALTTAGAVRVSAGVFQPDGTAVSWWVSADGGRNWTAATAGRWAIIPRSEWGTEVLWKAQLTSTGLHATPVITAPMTLEAGTPPAVAGLAMTPFSDTWVTSLTPTISWTFADADPGDLQTGKQVVIRDRVTGAEVLNTGKWSSLPDPAPPGDGSGLTANEPAAELAFFDVPLGHLNRSGSYRFTASVRVWDTTDLPSAWTSQDFEVLAAGNLRVVRIVDPPAGQVAPPPDIRNLPVLVKAGAGFDLALDVVGPPGLGVHGSQAADWETKEVRWEKESGVTYRAATHTSATMADAPVYETVVVRGPDGTEAHLGPVHVATVKGTVLEDWVIVNVR